MIIPSRRRAALAAIACTAATGGALAAIHYHRLGLTLSHYDARGHLVVARRVIDSLTPGWQQIGAVWLPLPHLLNVLPVQVDALYRSGVSAVAISVIAFAVATTAIASIVLALTESAPAAVAGAAVFACNPNVLYLQATPMTEPLMLALTLTAVAMLMAWCRGDARLTRRATDENERERAATDGDHGLDGRANPDNAKSDRPATTDRRARLPLGGPRGRQPSVIGLTFALACLTRYEAWPVTACAILAATWACRRAGDPWPEALGRMSAIARYPAAAVLAFLVFSRIVIGHWFVSGGFFVPENKALGDPLLAAAEIWWGTRMLSGPVTLAIAAAGLVVLLAASFTTRLVASARPAGLGALSLLATAALPWAAFVNGHPFRIRYMVPLLAIEAVGVGVAVGAVSPFKAGGAGRPGDFRDLARPLRLVLALFVLIVVAYELHPLDARAPMVVEAQWEQPNAPLRKTVTCYLRANYDGTTIMASMGSLGHYMQEASRDGFAVRDFLHEGNGDLWLAALDGPRPFVGWVMIEEKANGGDMLAKIARENPRFLDGFSRVSEGAGLALYRRQNLKPMVNR